MQIKLEDLPFAELVAHLPRTTTFIRDALTSNPESRVLVHCAEGVSRSVSVVAAYLMAEYGWLPNDALEYIRTKRVVANPNFGFVQQLHEYARNTLSPSNPIPSPLPPFSAPP
jgi:atypical dual specificity phosphatase